MDVLPGALPENFFLTASSECLQAMVPLVDIGLAQKLNAYCTSSSADRKVVSIIQQYYSAAIKHATFHQELHDAGIVASLRSLNLDALSVTRDVATIEKYIKDIEFYRDNQTFVHSRITPRSKEDFQNFVSLAPDEYRSAITRNRDYFYYPHAQEINTGLSSIVRRSQDLEIAYKGLQARLYMLKHGGQKWEEALRRV